MALALLFIRHPAGDPGRDQPCPDQNPLLNKVAPRPGSQLS
jgi:hypothetical protein